MSNSVEDRPWSVKQLVLSLLALLLTLVVFFRVGNEYLNGYNLALNGFNIPVPRDAYFQYFWLFFGGLSSLFMAAVFGEVRKAQAVQRLIKESSEVPETQWIILLSLLATMLSLLIHSIVLNGVWVTDDEEAYQFSARLLAEGKLFIDSYPEKEFFDRQFVVNNGRMFTQYFLGWPALMVPGVWIGQEWVINPILSALTVYPFFYVIKHYTSTGCARFMTILYVLSPMLLIGAATKHSHTSCMLFLWLTLWSWVQWQKSSRAGWLALVALCFSVAFFIRPSSSLGIGLPVLVIAAVSALRTLDRRVVTRAAMLLIPCLAMGAAFLSVNKIQNGSYLKVAYQSYEKWHFSDDRVFTVPSTVRPPSVGPAQGGDLYRGIASSGMAMLRTNSDLLGWPLSLVFVIAAWFIVRNKMIWAMIPCYLGLHWFIKNVGVGVYAPMHYVELAIPLFILTAQGIHLLSRKAEQSADPWIAHRSSTPYLYAAACTALAVAIYLPIKFISIERLTSDISRPLHVVKERNLRNALVFSPTPFTRNCGSSPAVASAYFMPINSPSLEDDVLWVNHISYRRDVEFATRFPRREAYLMYWTDTCELDIAPLRSLDPEHIQDNPVVNPKFL